METESTSMQLEAAFHTVRSFWTTTFQASSNLRMSFWHGMASQADALE